MLCLVRLGLKLAVLWRTSRPDVVVLDHNLPDGNALDLIVRLRPFDPDIPIIILTAEASIDLAVQAVKLGAEQFLTKPIELTALLVVIQRVYRKPEERQKTDGGKEPSIERKSGPISWAQPRNSQVCLKYVPKWLLLTAQS